MRKVHYKVVLDIFVHEEDETDGIGVLMCADFQPGLSEDGMDIVDVTIDSIEVSDSR